MSPRRYLTEVEDLRSFCEFRSNPNTAHSGGEEVRSHSRWAVLIARFGTAAFMPPRTLDPARGGQARHVAVPDLWSPRPGSRGQRTQRRLGARPPPRDPPARTAPAQRGAGRRFRQSAPRGRASRRPRLPARPRPRPLPAGPAPAHLALADAEDAAAAAQAHAGASGPCGRAAEGEGAARGAQALHRGAHKCGRSAPPARPQV